MNKNALAENEALARTVVAGIMENFPEASHGNALRCCGWDYDGLTFDFRDTEDGGDELFIGWPELFKAWALLFSDKWPKGCTPAPQSDKPEAWEEWLGQCDATDFDAFAQLACLGEVIYG